MEERNKCNFIWGSWTLDHSTAYTLWIYKIRSKSSKTTRHCVGMQLWWDCPGVTAHLAVFTTHYIAAVVHGQCL